MSTVRPYVLTIAGFDPSGGAGLIADIKTLEINKVYGLGICSALTYQNNEIFDDDLPPGVRDSLSTLLHVFDGPASKLPLNYDYLNGEDKTKIINRVLKWAIGNLTADVGPNMEEWLTPVRILFFSQQGALPMPIMHSMNRGTYNQIVEMPKWKWWHLFRRPDPHAVNVIPPGQSGFMNYLGQFEHAYDQLILYETWTYKPMIFSYSDLRQVEESRKILYYNN